MFPLVAQKSITPHGGEVGVFGMFQSLSSPSVDKLTHSLQPVSWGTTLFATFHWVVVGQTTDLVPIPLTRFGVEVGGQTKVMFLGYYQHYTSLASETLCPQAHMALCQAQ